MPELDPIRPPGQHIFGSGLADDQLHYHLKGSSGDSKAALNEFLLTHLGRVAKLPTVAFKPARHAGQYFFGSETQTGLCSQTEISRLLQGSLVCDGLPAALTRSLSFDILTGNPDRHYKNFLIQQRANGHRTLRVIDFSTGGLMSPCWKSCIPISEQSETIKQLFKLRGSLGLDVDAGRSVLTILGALPDNYWDRFTDQMPTTWSGSNDFQDFKLWWSDGRRDSLEMANKELDAYAKH